MLIFIIILFTALVVLLTILFINKYHRRFIIKNSVSLNKLEELNNDTVFCDITSFNEMHAYDNQKMYDGISCLDYLTYQLQFKKRDVLQQIEKAKRNSVLFAKYNTSVNEISEFGIFSAPVGLLNVKKLKSIEKELFDKKVLRPTTSFCIKISLYLNTINGRTYAEKAETFNSCEIEDIIKRLNYKYLGYYKDKSIWNSICNVERGKVSNKMRFSIYKRDGYRCCICGRSGAFDDLEIDHIKPIAKGGKSTYDNLQTLCHRCNQLKGDTYEKSLDDFFQ